MSVLTNENPTVVTLDGEVDEPQDIIHIYCECNEELALCGEDLGGPFWENAPEEDECVVCVDLTKQPCPLCGEELEA